MQYHSTWNPANASKLLVAVVVLARLSRVPEELHQLHRDCVMDAEASSRPPMP